MAVDRLADREGAGPFREKFKGLFTKLAFGSQDVVLLKPLTFMNLSGESVRAAMDFFKIPLDHVLVVHDELDLDFGVLRLKVGGGTAGHNGLKSIVQHGGAPSFSRLRFGIGRPRSGSGASYVLSDFSSEERAELPDHLDRACDALADVFAQGIRKAMDRVNQRVPAR